MRPDAVEPWLAVVGPGLEAEPLLTRSFFLGPTRLADLTGDGQGFRTPDAVAAAYQVGVATLGRYLAASPEMYVAVAAAILGPEGLAAWHARDWPTDPAENHSRTGVGWTDKYLGALRLFEIYCLPKINRAGLSDDRLFAMADYSHGLLKSAEAEHRCKAVRSKRPSDELKVLAAMPCSTKDQQNAVIDAYYRDPDSALKLSDAALQRLENTSRLSGVRSRPGFLSHHVAAIEGATEALKNHRLPPEVSSGIKALRKALEGSGGESFACAEAWEAAPWIVRTLVEQNVSALPIESPERGPVSSEAVVWLAKKSQGRRGRVTPWRRVEVEFNLKDDYLAVTGKARLDWSRASEYCGPYVEFLKVIGNLYGNLALEQELK